MSSLAPGQVAELLVTCDELVRRHSWRPLSPMSSSQDGSVTLGSVGVGEHGSVDDVGEASLQ